MSTFGMSDKQLAKYQEMKGIGFEYSLTEETGSVRMIRYDRGPEWTRRMEEIAVDELGDIDILFSAPPPARTEP